MGRRLFNRVLGGLLGVLLGMAVPGAGPMTAAAAPVRILALGDSLTAGFGLPGDDGFTRQLERVLRAQGYPVEVINAGVSGDTTAGGLARLDWALADNPDVVIVSLGANDMLRGIDPAVTRANLDAILKRLAERRLPVLLAGMVASANLGRGFAERFNALYPELARRYGVPLYPFFLEGVAMMPKLNQSDGLHPNAAGVTVMVEGIKPHVIRLIEARQAARG